MVKPQVSEDVTILQVSDDAPTIPVLVNAHVVQVSKCLRPDYQVGNWKNSSDVGAFATGQYILIINVTY